MGGWMDRWASYFSLLSWATSSLSDLFAEALRWGTSFLSYFFSNHALSLASATQVFSSRIWYNPFCNLHLQSRIAQK
jgi:hypothetical protein